MALPSPCPGHTLFHVSPALPGPEGTLLGFVSVPHPGEAGSPVLQLPLAPGASGLGLRLCQAGSGHD